MCVQGCFLDVKRPCVELVPVTWLPTSAAKIPRVSNMAKTEIGKIKQHGTGSQNFHLRTSGLSWLRKLRSHNQELIVVSIWSYLIHILNKRKDSPLTLTPCIIMGEVRTLIVAWGGMKSPKGT